jgi:hypothetical protein
MHIPKTFLLSLLLFLVGTLATAQLTVVPTKGLIGQEVRIPLLLAGVASKGTPLVLSGTLKLGNSTVFFPERFISPDGDSILGFALTAVTDSVYSFSVTLRNNTTPRSGGDTLVYLAGEALAGSDTNCTIAILSPLLNGTPIAEARDLLTTRSIGPQLPYVRFATLEQNFPNPIRRGQKTTWGYRIDKLSEVTFIIYSLLGQELDIIELGEQTIGPHTFTYTPGFTAPSGVYWVRLVTNSGLADKPFHIVR